MIPFLIAGSASAWVANNVVGASEALSNFFDPKITTAPPTGSGNSLADLAAGKYLFKVQTIAPSDEDMRALDDFYEAYGYNISQFRQPNLKVRDTFTFIQTKDAQVTAGNLETANQMAAMLNAGCKFWNTEIGA